MVERFEYDLDEFDQNIELRNRVRLVTRLNPFMAQNPDAVYRMAALPIPTSQLGDSSFALYGMTAADRLLGQLQSMGSIEQRSVFARLPLAQQQALKTQGYEPPSDNPTLLNAVGKVLGIPLSGVQAVIGGLGQATKPIWQPTLQGLTWLNDQPARVYRAVRTMDDDDQWRALAGAAIGVGGALLALPTGGASVAGSIAALGALGLAGTAGAAAGVSILDPMDFGKAFIAAGDGERTFDRPSQLEAQQLLGDPRLMGVAYNMADGSTRNVYDIAREVAGIRKTAEGMTLQTRQAELLKIADGIAQPGSQQHTQAYQSLLNLLNEPLFLQAVDTLQKGKISIGRDVADNLQLDPDGDLHRYVSGALDGVFTVAVDPTLALGKAVELNKFRRFGLDAGDGMENLQRFQKLSDEVPSVRRLHEKLAEAVDTNDFELARRLAPGFDQLWDPIRSFRVREGIAPGEFKREHIVKYLVDNARMDTLLRGIGTARGKNKIILRGFNARNQLWMDINRNLRSMTSGFTDIRLEQRMIRQMINSGDQRMLDIIPEHLRPAPFTSSDLPVLRTVANLDVGADGAWRVADANLGAANDLAFEISDTLLRKADLDADDVDLLEDIRIRATQANFNPTSGNVDDLRAANRLRELATAYEKLDIGDIVERISDDLGRIAIASDPVPEARRMGRAIAERLPRTSYAVGSVAQMMTTMIPPQGAIRFVAEDAPEQVRRAAELMRFAYMPEYMRRMWFQDIMSTTSGNLRAKGIMSMFDNALSVAGVRELKGGEDMIDEILTGVSKAYAFGGADEVVLKSGRKVRVSALLEDSADFIKLPDLSEMRRNIKVTNTARAFGLLDFSVVDTFINQIWKPAVLLRLAFIPRAAGEEWINFTMRSGYGSMIQNYGAGYIGRFKAWEDVIAKVDSLLSQNIQIRVTNDGLGLTRDEMRLFQQGPLPAPLRAVERTMQRLEWSEPVMRKLKDVNDLLREFLTPASMGGVGGLGVREPIEQAIRGIGGEARESMLRGASEATLRRQYGRFSPEAMRLNVSQYADSILLGNPMSWRRMLSGGVDDVAIRAAREYQLMHFTRLMNEASAVEAGHYERRYQRDDVITRTVIEDGKEKELRFVAERGGHKRLNINEDAFVRRGAHGSLMHAVYDDPGGTAVVGNVWSRVLPKGVTLGDAEQFVRNVDAIGDAVVVNTLSSLARNDPREVFDVTVDFLGRRNDVLKVVAAQMPTYGNVTTDDFIEAARRTLDNGVAARAGNAEARQALTTAMTAAGFDTARMARGITAEDQKLLEQFLSPEVETVLSTLNRQYRRKSDYGEWYEQLFSSVVARPQTFLLPGLDEAAEVAGPTMRFYRSIDEATEDAIAEAQSYYTATYNQEKQAMNRFLGEEPGLAQDETVVLWSIDDAVDSLPTIADSVGTALFNADGAFDAQTMASAIVDVLVRNADNPQVLLSKRAVLEQWVVRHMENAAIVNGSFGGMSLAGQNGLLFFGVDQQQSVRRIRRARDEAASRGLDQPTLPALKFVFADRQVVDQLNRSLHRTIGGELSLPVPEQVNIYGVRVGRAVMDDRITSLGSAPGTNIISTRPTQAQGEALAMPMGVNPTDRSQVELWSLPRDFTMPRMQSLTDLEPVDKSRDMAEALVTMLRGRLSKQQRELYRPRTRRTITTNPDGSVAEGEIARVYQLDAYRVPRPVPVGEVLRPEGTYFNEKGVRIEVRDGKYTEPALLEIEDDLMWTAVSPMIRDINDRQLALLRMRPKNEIVSVQGKVEASPDWIPVYRSNESQIPGLSDGGPEIVIAPRYTEVKENLWEKIVRIGFDKVIGPSIDAIVRKPMAFHFFAQRYRIAETNYKTWLVDQELANQTFELVRGLAPKYGARAYSPAEFETNLGNIKRLMQADGMVGAEEWTTKATAAWVRGHTPDELDKALDSAVARVQSRLTDPNLSDAEALRLAVLDTDVKLLRASGSQAVIDGVGYGFSLDEIIETLRAQLPQTAFGSVKALQRAYGDEFGALMPTQTAESVVAYVRSLRHAETAAGKYAAEAALMDIMPFVDSQEVRTQFAEYGKNLLPFWYAEENFLKRWARTFLDDPTVIQKAQLTYQGMRTVGIIRTDENGRDWFVYPGSSLLLDVLQKVLPGAPIASIGTMFQSPTDMMFPGLSERFGQPGWSPWVSLPVELASGVFPELQPFERAVLGDIGASREWHQHLVPATLSNFWEAATGDEDSSRRFLAAFNAALAYKEASGQGLPANADFQQRDEYLRDVREHARIIVVAQALAGFATPGPAMPLYAGETESFTGLGALSPGDILNDQYLRLVRELGIEDGTARYLEMNPQAQFKEIFKPEAFTVGRSESVSGAPMPSTQDALNFYNDNRDYMNAMTYAGAWLMPSPPRDPDMKSQYIFDQQVLNDMRRQRTPEEFLDELKFREASPTYFYWNRFYDQEIDRAKAVGDETRAKAIRDVKSSWSQTWRASHPVFERMLSSTDNAVRRQQTLSQMRTIVNDPQAPQSTKLPGMRTLMDEYDRYQGLLAEYREDGTYGGKANLEQLKLNWSRYLDYFVSQNPELQAFVISVMRPESSLD